MYGGRYCITSVYIMFEYFIWQSNNYFCPDHFGFSPSPNVFYKGTLPLIENNDIPKEIYLFQFIRSVFLVVAGVQF